MITITVTPQQMLEALLVADIDVPTAKSIILDLILASDGGLLVPRAEEGQVADANGVLEDEELVAAEDEEATEDQTQRKKPRRVNFKSFGGAVDFKGSN